MAIIDQSEIDDLLKEVDGAGGDKSSGGKDATVPVQPPSAPRPLNLPDTPEVRRVLRVKVPVIVQLAQRNMPIATARELAVGAIIEFEKSVEEDLELMVNNRRIGFGTCVKVGENFGLRVSRIATRRQRVESLGNA